MKKILMVLILIGLLGSCKTKENSKNADTEKTTKDDYQNADDNKDKTDKSEKTTTDYKEKINPNQDELDEDGNSKADIESITGQDDSEAWPQTERDAFTSNCVNAAVKAGKSRSLSQKYCDCMLRKIEGMYPNIEDAAKLSDQEVDQITTKYAPGCLK